MIAGHTSRIARKFRVGQTRAAKNNLICTNRFGREKIVRAGCANDVILIDAITTDADRADHLAIAIKRETSGKNGDSVRKIGVNDNSD